MNAVKKLATVVALLFMTINPISMASAHTEIDHTTPSAGDTVDAGVQTVSVVFTDKILDLANSSEIIITDADGNEIENTCVEVKNTSLKVQAFLPNAGDYEVNWRTVAEDGHPIEGKFGFAVSGSAEQSDFASCQDLATEGNVVIATPKAMPLGAVEKTVKAETGIIWPFWVAGVLVIGVGAFVLVRRKSTKG